jgi:GNAT superfamily N-acetyltransferase
MIHVRPLAEEARPWAFEIETDSWGEPVVARLGELVNPTGLPGFIAFLSGERARLVSYAVRGDECEVVTIRSLHEGHGIGRALLDSVRDAAIEAGCRRLWLINDQQQPRGRTTRTSPPSWTRSSEVGQRAAVGSCGFGRRSRSPSISGRGAPARRRRSRRRGRRRAHDGDRRVRRGRRERRLERAGLRPPAK